MRRWARLGCALAVLLYCLCVTSLLGCCQAFSGLLTLLPALAKLLQLKLRGLALKDIHRPNAWGWQGVWGVGACVRAHAHVYARWPHARCTHARPRWQLRAVASAPVARTSLQHARGAVEHALQVRRDFTGLIGQQLVTLATHNR